MKCFEPKSHEFSSPGGAQAEANRLLDSVFFEKSSSPGSQSSGILDSLESQLLYLNS